MPRLQVEVESLDPNGPPGSIQILLLSLLEAVPLLVATLKMPISEMDLSG